MKNLRNAMLCLCVLFSGFIASAQNDKVPINEPDYNKPRLFKNMPDRIPVTAEDLNALINAPVGRTTSFNFSTESATLFNGEVISAADKYDSRIQSVVIRSTNFNGARFTLSKILNDDGTYSFTGRIISFQHGDLYELKNEAGNMVLVKKDYYELVNE